MNLRELAERWRDSKLSNLHLCANELEAWIDENTNWQPIETAPKDGLTSILVFMYGSTMATAYWDGYGFVPDGVELTYDMTEIVFEATPTHWMPLPTPPQEDE